MKWVLILALIAVAAYLLKRVLDHRKEEERKRLRKALAVTKRVGSERSQY